MAYDMWSEQSNKTFFTNHIQMKRYIDNFIQRDKKDNPLDIYTNIWGSIKPWKWIDEGLPVMLMGHLWTYGYHAVVAYGYWKDKNKYLVHYGWEDQSQVIMSTSFLFETWSIALKPKYDSYLNTRYFLLDNKEISLKSYTKMMANPNEKYPDDYPFKDYYWYW
ncbi:Uncharacterised protein [Metamycoplasma arthritidis]|nr:hypothetical protein [Metamycoplasma arthritidis]VEU79061.1 Uncharacterised protein [Metamycoplasma arthritidis]